jgi:DNA-binding transcriptional ArsR family regulator
MPARKTKTASKSGKQNSHGKHSVGTAHVNLEIVFQKDTRQVEFSANVNGRKSAGCNGQTDAGTERSMLGRKMRRGCNPENISQLFSAMSHVQRVAILCQLLEGESDHQTLAEVTGLKAGPLYHHLRELRYAGLIGPKVRDSYKITRKGQRAILAAQAVERACR